MAAVMSLWLSYTRHSALLRHRATSVSHKRDVRVMTMAFVGWAGVAEEARVVRGEADKMGRAQSLGLQV